MATPVSPQTRPGGRSARVRADVHRATLELLAEGSPDALTLPLIATRAGVHPTTLYRRWGSVGDLLTEVASSSFSGEIVVPDSGSLRADLERWIRHVVTDLADPDMLALMRAAIGAAGYEGGSACVADRLSQLEAIIERAGTRGEPAPTVETAADLLLGPVYFRALFAGDDTHPGADWAARLVDHLLRDAAALD